MSDDNEEFLAEYITEASEHLANAEEQLLSLGEGPTNHDAMDSCFRSLHTVKGGAGFLDLSRIQSVAHVTEQLLEELNNNNIICTSDHVNILLESVTQLTDLLQGDNLVPGAESTPEDQILIDRITVYLEAGNAKEDAASEEKAAHVEEFNFSSAAQEDFVALATMDAIDIPTIIRIVDSIRAIADLPETVQEVIDGIQTCCDSIMFADDDAQAIALNDIKGDAQSIVEFYNMQADQDGGLNSTATLDELTTLADDGIPELIRMLETLDACASQEQWSQKASEMLHHIQDLCDTAMFADTQEQIDTIKTIRQKGANLRNIVINGDSASEQQDFIDIGSDFIPETSELLNIIEDVILNRDTANHHDILEVLRSFHTIKGIASYIGLPHIAVLVHHIETHLAQLREQDAVCNEQDKELILTSIDSIRTLCKHITHVGNDSGCWPDSVLALCRKLGATDLLANCGKGESVVDSTLPPSQESSVLPPEKDRTPRIGDLLVANGIDRKAVEKGEHNRKPGQTIGESIVESGGATQSQIDNAAKEQQVIKTKIKSENTTRVNTSRLDDLIDLVGELLISEAMVTQKIEKNPDQILQQSAQSMRRIVRDLQSLSMSLRMVPLKTTFRKMARAVHDTARKVGKNIKFDIIGEETEIDRILVEKLADPLLHMVRNAADHGIEATEARINNNKNEQGTITLSACQTSEHVVIELRDDGGGLDPEFLRKKAVEKGLIEADQKLSVQECYFLIFKAGFSTAAAVTGISGRGVGMDVVRRNIQEMNGIIEIASEMGTGTTFTIRLPLTTAILDAMLIRCGNQRFLMPITSIIEANRPGPEEVESILGSAKVYRSRGKLLPLVTMGEELNLRSYVKNPQEAIVIVVECYSGSFALQVDEILGQHQAVIKSLNYNFIHHQCLAGSAILGDGQVGLIIDPNRLTDSQADRTTQHDTDIAV